MFIFNVVESWLTFIVVVFGFIAVLKKGNSMKEIRELAEMNPDLKNEWARSVQPIMDTFSNRFKRLSLKDKPVSIHRKHKHWHDVGIMIFSSDISSISFIVGVIGLTLMHIQ